MLALIHAAFTINIFFAIGGLTLFLSGALLHFRSKEMIKAQAKLLEINQIEVIPNNQRNISTSGGNYNENIGRDYIGRDSVTKNIKNITLGDREVKIDPNYLVDTFDEFRDILTQSITQSSNALEAISEFANQLTEELRKQPEVKSYFNVDRDISAQELVNKIFLDLLNTDYEQINEIYPVTRISSNQIQSINNFSESAYIERFESNGNNEYDFLYKDYTVHLFLDQSRMWNHRIRRPDSSLVKHSYRRTRNIYSAFGKAIDMIDKELEEIWKTNMTNPE